MDRPDVQIERGAHQRRQGDIRRRRRAGSQHRMTTQPADVPVQSVAYTDLTELAGRICASTSKEELPVDISAPVYDITRFHPVSRTRRAINEFGWLFPHSRA